MMNHNVIFGTLSLMTNQNMKLKTMSSVLYLILCGMPPNKGTFFSLVVEA